MVEEDARILRLIGRAAGDAQFKVFKRLQIFPGIEFAKSSQRQGRSSIGSELQIPVQCIACRDISIRVVLQDSKEPPAIRPIRVLLDSFSIKCDGRRNIALLARGIGAGYQGSKGIGSLRSSRQRQDASAYKDEKTHPANQTNSFGRSHRGPDAFRISQPHPIPAHAVIHSRNYF